MSAQNNALAPNVATIPIGSLASAMNIVLPGIYFSKKSRIKRVDFVDQAGVASNSSNKLSIQLQDNAGSPVAYASISTFGNAAVALAPLSLTKKAAVQTAEDGSGELEVPAGTMLNLSIVGSGTAVTTSAVALIEWYPK